MIDYLYESQVKNKDDEEYLARENEIHIPTFSTRRQKLRNEGCHLRMKDEFESMTAIARNDHNKKYFDTRLIQPLVAEEFIKQLYTIYNSDKEHGFARIFVSY